MSTPKVKVSIKPLLKPWVPWKYVSGNGYELTENDYEATIFSDNALYKVQDYYFFYRKQYEISWEEEV